MPPVSHRKSGVQFSISNRCPVESFSLQSNRCFFDLYAPPPAIASAKNTRVMARLLPSTAPLLGAASYPAIHIFETFTRYDSLKKVCTLALRRLISARAIGRPALRMASRLSRRRRHAR